MHISSKMSACRRDFELNIPFFIIDDELLEKHNEILEKS